MVTFQVFGGMALVYLVFSVCSGCYEKTEPMSRYRDEPQIAQSAQTMPASAPSNQEANPGKPLPTSPEASNSPLPPAAKPAAPGTNPATGTTAVAFTPVSYAGAQYPAFVYAIWVTDANNKYIKTISARAATRMRYLDKWLTAAGVTAPTQPDGVTGASIPYPATPAAISVNWDMKDKAGAIVPQGNYTINFQLTSSNNAGLNLLVPVTINSAGITKTDTTMNSGISAVSIKHSP